MKEIFDLKERMAAHVPGQVTWPVLNGMRRYCESCRYWQYSKTTAKGQKLGRCEMVHNMDQGALGALFDGAEAIACSLHRRIDTLSE